MTIMTFTPQAIEGFFSSLPQGERAAIISYGIAIRLSNLRKRLFLAESKVKHFEEKFQITLAELDAEGLPDDADWEMHEDYILWHHWAEVIGKTREALVSLEEMVTTHHANFPHHKHVGRREDRQPCSETCLEDVMEVIIPELPR